MRNPLSRFVLVLVAVMALGCLAKCRMDASAGGKEKVSAPVQENEGFLGKELSDFSPEAVVLPRSEPGVTLQEREAYASGFWDGASVCANWYEQREPLTNGVRDWEYAGTNAERLLSRFK
jgi:hypothetical protein